MSSRLQKREILENLFFSFTMKLATAEDFAYFIQKTNIPLYSNMNSYIVKINNYFSNNYFQHLRSYAEHLLNNQQYSHILTELDNRYLKRYTPSELLNVINEYYLSGNKENNILNRIKLSINSLFKDKKNKDLIPDELLFYLHVVSKIQTQKQTLITQVKQMLIHTQHSKNLLNIMNLHSELNLNVINEQEVNNMLLENLCKDIDYNYKYAMIIEIFQYITVPPRNEHDFRTEINKYLSTSKLLNVNVYRHIEVLDEFFDFFGNINLHSQKLLFIFFQLTIERFKLLNADFIINIMKWIFSQIEIYAIKISEIQDMFYQYANEYFHLFLKAKEFTTTILPKVFIQLTEQGKNDNSLLSYSNNFNKIISMINSSNNDFPFQLKFSSFYFQLFSDIYEKQVIMDKIRKIKLDKEEEIYDILFILMYVHSDSREIMKKKNLFLNLIHKIENESYIDFNKEEISKHQVMKSYESLKKQTFYLHKVVGISVNDYIEKNLRYFPYVLCLKISKNDVNSFDYKLCFKHKVIKVSYEANNYIYDFNGFVFIENNNQKNILFYEKTSQCWYSLKDKQWISTLKIPTEIKKIYVIFFKRNYSDINNIEFRYNETNITLKSKDNNTKLYWKAFLSIFEINPSLIKKNFNVYSNFFSLNNQENLNKIINYFEKKEIINNEEIKALIELMKNNIQCNSKRDIFKDCNYFWKPEYFLKKIETHILSNDNESLKFKKEIERNILYYLNNINDIKDIPSKLLFYIIALILLCTKSNFVENERRILFQNFQQIQLIPSNVREYILNLQELSINFPDKTQLEQLIFYFQKKQFLMIDDYKWKFLCELMIYMFNINLISQPYSNTRINEPDQKISVDLENHTQICKLLATLLSNNKAIISIKNINNKDDITISLKLLYEFLQCKFIKDQTFYSELISICFESIQEDSLQLNKLQEIVFHDYLNYYLIKREDIIQTHRIDFIMNKLTYISRFIYDNESQQLFAKILLSLKERKDNFDKIIKPLLFKIFDYCKNKNCSDLRYAIVYYLLYCKIERKKEKIKRYNFMKYLSQPHYIFIFMNKSIQKILKQCEGVQNQNFIPHLYKEFTLSNIIQQQFKNFYIEYDSKDLIKNDLKLFATNLTKNQDKECNEFFIIDDTNIQLNINTTLPHNLVYEQKPPYIIFKYDNPNEILKEEIKFSKREYQLKGMIITAENKSGILIRNNINSYWFSVCDREWIESIDSYFENVKEIIKVYYLIETKKDYLKFDDIDINEKKSVLFPQYINTDLRWLLGNGIWFLINNHKIIENMFNLMDNKMKNELFKLDIPWNKEHFVKFKEKVELISISNLENSLLK